MGSVYYRNKRTGEFKDVDPDSREARGLQAERDGNGQPVWEQTSLPHGDSVKERATYGELDPTDLGHDDQAEVRAREAALATAGVGPDPAPYQNLTPGEIEAGLTPEQKAQDLQAMFPDEGDVEHVAGVFDSAADRIADERKQRPAAGEATGQLARSGGSDDRDNVPRPDAKGGGKSKSSGSKAADSGSGSPSSGS